MGYQKECYYLIKKHHLSVEIIKACLNVSRNFWHSLGIITTANVDDLSDKKLTLKKIQEICAHAKLIMVEAYDGESYVFWESEDTPNFLNIPEGKEN